MTRQAGDKFHCPYCGVEVIAKRHNSYTCGKRECCNARVVDYKRGAYIPSRHRPKDNKEPPKTRYCLKCDKEFQDPIYRRCPHCRELGRLMSETHTEEALLAGGF